MTETTSKLFFLSKDREVFKDGNKFSQKNKGEDKKLEESDVKKLVKNRCELFLRSENLVILTGAGSSKDGGLLLVSELWEKIFPEEKDGSFSDRVGNLFLSINSKGDKRELVVNNKNLKTIWYKFHMNNKFNDKEAIDNLNKLVVFMKSCNKNFSAEPLRSTAKSEELNVVFSAFIKESEENKIYPLTFRKSQDFEKRCREPRLNLSTKPSFNYTIIFSLDPKETLIYFLATFLTPNAEIHS
jgi:hypothetical protein